MKKNLKLGLLMAVTLGLTAGCEFDDSRDFEVVQRVSSLSLPPVAVVMNSSAENAILSCESVQGVYTLVNDSMTCKYGSNSITSNLDSFPDLSKLDMSKKADLSNSAIALNSSFQKKSID